MSQTTYNTEYTIGKMGQVADSSSRKIDGFVAEGPIKYGLLVQKGTSDDQVKPMAALPSSDGDAIIDGLATTAGDRTLSGATLNGAVGSGIITPSQLVTMTFNNHADWNATTAVVYGSGSDGSPVREEFSIPDGGNTTLTGKVVFSRVSNIFLPAQGGTNGVLDVGLDPTVCELSKQSYPGVAIYDPMREPYLSTSEVSDESTLDVIVEGRVYVEVEAAVTWGDDVWVRTVESGGDVRGQFRGTYAANFARLVGAKFVSSATADGIAVLELTS